MSPLLFKNGNIPAPLTGVNGSLVNIDNSNFPGRLFSSAIPNHGLPEPLNKVQAAASIDPGLTGGKPRHLRKRINNISNMYKMKGGRKSIKKRISRMKRRLMSRFNKSRRHLRKTSRKSKSGKGSRRMRGGHTQFQNNNPMTGSFWAHTKLPPTLSALANPVPIERHSSHVNCIDNYNHFTNQGSASKGWW
jgi:hypothetical protein